jgi:hypothetical protein
MKTLLLDTRKLAAVETLGTVKFHEPSFDLQKVVEEVNLTELVSDKDIQDPAEEMIKKVDL